MEINLSYSYPAYIECKLKFMGAKSLSTISRAISSIPSEWRGSIRRDMFLSNLFSSTSSVPFLLQYFDFCGFLTLARAVLEQLLWFEHTNIDLDEIFHVKGLSLPFANWVGCARRFCDLNYIVAALLAELLKMC